MFIFGKKSLKIRAHFNHTFAVDVSVSDKVSPGKSKTYQVRSIIDAILAWLSFQAKCFNEKQTELQFQAEVIYGTFWKKNKEKPVGLFYNHRQNYLRFCYYEKGVTEEEVLSNTSMGETIISVSFADNQSVLEMIECVYAVCGCEIGHKDVCPVFGFKLLMKKIQKED